MPFKAWLDVHWPRWAKILGIIGLLGGAIGPASLVIGWGIGAIKNHDEAIKAKVLSDQAVVARNDKIDATLKYHGQMIYDLRKAQDLQGSKIDEILKTVKKK